MTIALEPIGVVRGGRAEARNVIRAIGAARAMRTLPPLSVD